MSFGSNVLFYRKKFGITQEALAEKLEVTRQTVSRWETDSAFPDMDKLLILCDLFGCNMEVLVRGNAEAENAQRHEANLEAYNKHMNVYTAQITSGVTLILAGVTAMLFLSAAGTREVVGLVTFFVCITLAVFIFVAGGVAHGNFMRENPRVEKYSADKVSAFRRKLPWFIAGATALILIGVIAVVAMTYDEVKENLQKVDINWEQYDLIDNNGNSETMSSNFNDLAKVSEMMILVISVASFVILVLVFLFWLKNRVQEVGIFLSLGVPKFRIIGQIWSEAIMIAVLSLMLSFAVAPAVSKVTANYLVSQQVQQMQEEEKNNEGKVSTEYVAPKQDVQNISVEVTPEMYLLDGASVLVLITASVLVSGIVILKRNPKDILSEMS